MLKDSLNGAIAGAVGTVVLNIATYVDMAVRGRSSSSAPSQMVATVADKVHVPLSSKGVGVHDETAQNRESGLGALLGYVNGLGMGVVYGILRSQVNDDVSLPLAGAIIGLVAMAASDIPLVSLGVSNPKQWGVSGWASDLIPHLLYGVATAMTYEALK